MSNTNVPSPDESSVTRAEVLPYLRLSIDEERLNQQKTPKKELARRPIVTFCTPFVVKPQNNFRIARNEKVPDIKASLKREMEGAIECDSELLVDDVFRSLPFDPEEILRQLTHTPKWRGQFDKKSIGYITNNSAQLRHWVNWPETDKKDNEEGLCDYLNAVADEVRSLTGLRKCADDLVYSAEFKNRGPPTGFTTDRKPDLVVIPRSKRNAKAPWEDIRCHASLKVATRYRLDERHQLTEHARICFATRQDRRYFLAFGLCHKNLTFYYFDRSGAIYSRMYNVDAEPALFLRVAIGILFMNRAQLGYDESFFFEDGTTTLRAGKNTYQFTEDIYTDRSIRGRGTACFQVLCKTGKNVGKVCVVKDAWVDRSRVVKEVAMLNYLRGKVSNIPDLLYGGVVKVTDGSGRKVKDSTEIFRRTLEVEIRDHYRIIMTPCGVPIWFFASLTELLSATLDVVNGIEALDKIGVLHRDISLYNIVLVADGTSGVRKGYIIDFDYAIRLDRSTQRIIAKGKRTGTLPFMAVDVLSNAVEHAVLHDAESMFYVLIWITFTQAGPNDLKRAVGKDFKIKETILEDWCPEGDIDQARLNSIANTKRGVVNNLPAFKSQVLEKMDSYFEPLWNYLLEMSQAFFPPENDLSVYMKSKKSTSKVKSDDDKNITNGSGPEEDKRPKEEIFAKLKDILKRGIEEVRGIELAENEGTGTHANDTHDTENGKPVSDLVAPMQLRERMVDPGPKTAFPPALPPIQEIPIETEASRQLRRSDRLKSLEARLANSASGSVTSTGKRPRTDEGGKRSNNKKSRGSGQIDK